MPDFHQNFLHVGARLHIPIGRASCEVGTAYQAVKDSWRALWSRERCSLPVLSIVKCQCMENRSGRCFASPCLCCVAMTLEHKPGVVGANTSKQTILLMWISQVSCGCAILQLLSQAHPRHHLLPELGSLTWWLQHWELASTNRELWFMSPASIGCACLVASRAGDYR